jgi:hypothetical protein
MKNPHLIVGEPRRCVCGSYDGKAIGCADVIKALNRLEGYAQTQLNPSLFIRKGDRNPHPLPDGEDIMLLVQVLKPLLQECG